ncbi:MAG: hypothetical protein KBS95_05660 [Alistipes sp.]|nr:hypothetical protein [Candidatus Alistipes equi]
MKRFVLFVLILFTATLLYAENKVEKFNLPDSIYVGGQKAGHVQGIAYDFDRDCMYLSFTTRFLKVNRQGEIIGSIEKVQGHLGDMTVSPIDGKVYASLECIDDEIGKGVAKRLGIKGYTKEQSTFYVAVIDVARITRVGMDSEKDGLIETFCVHPAGVDYKRDFHGSAGMDGVTFVPKKGCGKKNKWQLCVAYGIYLDTKRTDNDCQILLTYDIKDYEPYLTPMKYGELHQNGPKQARDKYFIYTGNTKYGIQNLEYDNHTGKIFMAVYKGKKRQYANSDLFTLDWEPKTFAKSYEQAVKTAQPLGGWRFKWGSTGMFPIGDGYWYISENAKDKVHKTQSCTARLYYWNPQALNGPFLKLNEKK